MNQSLQKKLTQALNGIYVCLMEANDPDRLLLLDQAVRIAQRLDAPPPEWLSQKMLKAPGVSQLFVKHGLSSKLEKASRIKRRNRLAYFIAEAYDINNAKKHIAKGLRKYEFINKHLRDKYGLGDVEISEKSIRIEIYNFKKRLERGKAIITSIDTFERAILDDRFEAPYKQQP